MSSECVKLGFELGDRLQADEAYLPLHTTQTGTISAVWAMDAVAGCLAIVRAYHFDECLVSPEVS